MIRCSVKLQQVRGNNLQSGENNKIKAELKINKKYNGVLCKLNEYLIIILNGKAIQIHNKVKKITKKLLSTLQHTSSLNVTVGYIL
jgi:hypothetical protein